MKKSRIKKIVRSAARVFSVLVFVVFLLLFVLWIALNRIEGQAQKILSSSLRGRVEIKDITFSFPFKLTVKDVSIDLQDGTFFASKKLYADLNVFSLLNRKIKINKFVVDSPVFRAGSSPTENNKVTERDSAVVRKRETSKPLPFSIDVSDVRISSVDLVFPIKNKEDNLKIKGLGLIIKSSTVNRKKKEILDGVAAEVLIFSDSGKVKYITNNRSYTLNLISRISLKWQSAENWKTEAHIEAKSDYDIPEISLSLKAGCGDSIDTLFIKEFSAALGKSRIFSAAGSMVVPFTDSSDFSLIISGDAVNLSMVNRIISVFTEDSFVTISGKLIPVKGRISGTLKKPEGYISLGVRKLHLISDSLQVHCKGAKVTGSASGRSGMFGRQGKVYLSVDNTRIDKADSTLFDFYKGFLSVDAVLNDNLIPVSAKLTCGVDSVFGGRVRLLGSYLKKNTSFSAAFDFSVDSVYAGLIPGMKENYRGLLAADISAAAEGSGRIKTSVGLSVSNIALITDQDTLILPDISAGVKFLAERNDGKAWQIKRGLITGGDFISVPFRGGFDPEKSFFRLSAKQAVIKTEALTDFWQNTEGIEHIPINIKGDPCFDLNFVFLQKDSPYYKGSGNLIFPDINISMPEDSIDVSGINGKITFSLNQDDVFFTGVIGFDSLRAPKIRPQTFCMSKIEFKGGGEQSGRIKVDSLILKFDRGLINGGLSGYWEEKSASCTGAFFWRADSFSNSMSQVSGRGRAGLKFRFAMSGDTISVRGISTADSVFVKSGSSFTLNNLSMRVPFNFNVSAQGSFGLEDRSGLPFLSDAQNYSIQRSVYKNLCSEIGSIRADRISVKQFKIDNPDIDIVIRNGTVTVPFFGVYLMGGSVVGSLQINADNLKEGGVEYLFNGQFSNIDANYIAGPGKGEKTVINATASIKGKGLDPDKGIDVNGYFHISEMGSEFASALLKGIDPSGTDKSIQITRRLIKTGWKPLGFSFDLRHGYIYPSLSLSQPWFSPIRIPEKLEYGRLPLAFFMENMKRNKKEDLQ